ncbi:MAG: hypothetical protein EOP00_24680 [Pedobacter sp.]|nr:MAG: hypothetical protein EOP00_24680 [Pedobacter sp.]
MDTRKNQFDLEQHIDSWKTSVANTTLTTNDVTELELHLRDSFAYLQTLKLDEEEAWLIAVKRLGTNAQLNQEFKKVNQDYTVSKNWLMLLWGAMGFLLLQALFINVPIVSNYIIIGKDNSVRNSTVHIAEYYIVSAIILIATFFVVRKHAIITKWFALTLSKHSTTYALAGMFLGLCAAFLCFANFMGRVVNSRIYDHDLMQAYSVLIFVFYVTLVALTTYFTLRYRSPELFSFKKFSRNINWKTAFILGFLAQVPVQFTHGVYINGTTEGFLTIGLTILLFFPIGFMLSYTKKGLLNIVITQTVPMAIFIFGMLINESARGIFSVFYLTMLLSLATGYYFAKIKQPLSFTAN